MTDLDCITQDVNTERDSNFCPGIDYDPFLPSDDPYENAANYHKPLCSERNDPAAGGERDDLYWKWSYGEEGKLNRGEPSVLYRRDNVIWLPNKYPVASNFIVDFFASRTKAPICITALPNERGNGAPVTIYTRDASEIDDLVKAKDGPGWAVYFCVNSIVEGKKRNKENVAAIGVLHADLDHKGIVEDHKAILEALKLLPVPPSMIVFSGHGIHCYWFLKETMSVANRDSVEACLKEIARVLAGDPAVCEIARIMRLPGSHNTKNGECLNVHVVGGCGLEYSFKDLEKWFASADPVLTRVKPIEKEQEAGNGYDPNAPDYDPYDRYEVQERLDLDQLLDDMVYKGTGNGGNVNSTELVYCASMISRGVPVDKVIETLHGEILKRIPESAGWNWGEEIKTLRRMCKAWLIKHPDKLALQDELPPWVRNDQRIKKLLNSHESASPGVGTTENVVQFPASSTPPSNLCLSLDDWYGRDLPDPDCIQGEALTTTSRWLLAADTGLGKTLFAIAFGMRCSMGLDFLLWPGARPARVLYIDGEMSRRLLKRRLIDEANRLGTRPCNFFALSKEDIPQMQPLNTLAGQKAIENVIREHCGGNVDLVIFDNIMALISGNHAEEDGWAKTMPWIRDLTRRAIGQLWIHHTGHDSSRQYGTKTREWEMDTYIQLLKEENDYTDVSFTLTFRKARERMPTNRDQFADTKVSLMYDEWTWENTKKREKISPIGQKFFDALMLATIVNGNVVLSDDYPFTSIEKWRQKCINNGLLDPTSKPDAARSLFSKYKMELISKNWIKCDATSVWVIA